MGPKSSISGFDHIADAITSDFWNLLHIHKRLQTEQELDSGPIAHATIKRPLTLLSASHGRSKGDTLGDKIGKLTLIKVNPRE